MKPKKNLNRNAVRLLRKVQQFLIAEPRRFDMQYGVSKAEQVRSLLEFPPCGTACCIAGAAYAVSTGKKFKNSWVPWDVILKGIKQAHVDVDDNPIFNKLFYVKSMHMSASCWPEFYDQAYKAAKTPLQRACVGVARIEHFIATDGRE